MKQKNIKYYASLDNGSAVFDSGYFDTLDEALDWASGRGGSYGVGLEKVIDGEQQYRPGGALKATCRGSKTFFSERQIVGWCNVTRDEIAAML